MEILADLPIFRILILIFRTFFLMESAFSVGKYVCVGFSTPRGYEYLGLSTVRVKAFQTIYISSIQRSFPFPYFKRSSIPSQSYIESIILSILLLITKNPKS